MGGNAGLFDLAFLELDMLADFGVIFFDRHLLGHGPRVLFCDVERAGIGPAVQPDLDGGWLGHGVFLVSPMRRAANLLSRPSKSRQLHQLPGANLRVHAPINSRFLAEWIGAMPMAPDCGGGW